MKKLLSLILASVLVFTLFGCNKDSTGSEVKLADLDFSTVNRISLQNCHNGEYTTILEENDISAITSFLKKVTGTDSGSGKGYYEGTYAIICYRNDETVFSMAFGDSDCFYTGKGGDGYPIRYLLTGMTIADDVVPFFARFDQSISE